MNLFPLLLCTLSMSAQDTPQTVPYAASIKQITQEGLKNPASYTLLRELTKGIGGRLSGSANADRAVAWAKRRMERLGFSNVHLQKVMVPVWERSKTEEVSLLTSIRGVKGRMSACALGGSVGTPEDGITAPVIEVKSLKEAEALGSRAKGKIVFFNRPMDGSLPNTFAAYGGAVDQRVGGASAAARSGAVAVLVRSMGLAIDRTPHTGAMVYEANAPRIPAAAISTLDANKLSTRLKRDPGTRVHIKLGCRTLPDKPSANVIGEITGAVHPEEVIVLGGHLDSWDLAEGAHDDGSGCVQAIEAVSILRRLKLKPDRTIRVVLFMNEENGLRGATEYARAAGESKEKHLFAIESDDGGFSPVAFSTSASDAVLTAMRNFVPDLKVTGIQSVEKGGGGGDVDQLQKHGCISVGLGVSSHRYFDFHHTPNDKLEAVHPRELQMGAIAMSILAFHLSQSGLPATAPAESPAKP